MKGKFILKLLGLLFCIIITSCTKDDIATPNTADTDSKDEYYVHYEFPVYGTCQYRDCDGQLKDGPAPAHPFDKNPIHLNITIGPVKKGFNCYLTGQNGLNISLNPTMLIQVSKNSGVLVDKASYTFRDNGTHTLSYTIDF